MTTTITSTNSALNIYVYASKEKFNFTPPKLEAFKAKYETFSSTIKPTCAKLAETSSFLCVEAPGAKGAKALMDAAGPILAAVTSIQKACSNTAKVTDFAAKAMTIAKATCTAAKLACDGGCAVADTAVKAMQAELKVIEGSITADKSQAAGQCEMECEMKATSECSSATIAFMACYTPALAACNTPCQADVVAKDGKARAALKTLSAAIAKESLPAPPGSVAATQVKCQMNAKDIIGLATSALSLMNARNSAEECDKKLAAGGAAGGAVTPTQYCETPGNSGTQFCKCQQNANQEGCPGFAGKGLLIDKDAAKASVAGINLKTGKGLSSFAGGTRGTGAGFGNSSGEKNATNGSDPSTAEKLALAGGDAAASNGGGGGSTSGGGGSSAGGGAGEGSGGKPDSKKWSFGSFANALGGMFGGGSGGKNSNAKGNGNLNSKQEAAIKRKLASDKLAGEITSASGKSNWEKVHQVYLIKDNTLLTGN